MSYYINGIQEYLFGDYPSVYINGTQRGRAVVPVGPVVYLHDTASGPSTTSINGRTPDTVGDGTWSLEGSSNYIGVNGSGLFNITGATGTKYATYDIGVDSFTITADVKLANWTGLLIRYSDTQNHFDVSFNSGAIYIRERTGGTATERSSTTGTFVEGTTYSVTAVVTASTIDFSIGEVSTSYSSTSKNEYTRVGMVPLASSDQHKWDNIKATS